MTRLDDSGPPRRGWHVATAALVLLASVGWVVSPLASEALKRGQPLK
jgi:hypothetical protein